MRCLSAAALFAGAAAALSNSSTPTAKTINGTYEGRHLAGWDQDVFLGIPFAQPPVGQLRFRWPQSLNTSFSEVRAATEYGHTCIQHKSTLGITNNNDEDCLNLNIVRPSGYTDTSLPVLVWIYGGGLSAGSGADPQYNLSGIVKTAQESGQPLIGVSINYRLSIWGFLQSAQLLAEGSANAGLLDQRMALRWLQENIASFGGDPTRVTVWGESAGAQSIALHLHSYDGRDDGLFSSAILESGGPTGASLNTLPYYNAAMENLTRTVGCWGASDPLSCLRDLPAATLHGAHPSYVWNPLVDGDFLTGYPSDLREDGKFIKVPLLTGANTDEGTSFSIRNNLNNASSLANSLLSWRNYALSPPTIRRLLALYPDDATTPKPPFHVDPAEPFAQYGTQWRRSGAIGGDLVMIAQRRAMAEAYTDAGQDVWSYRFDTPLWNASQTTGANHFCNVVFSFQNISGALGPYPEYKELSLGIGRAYANFVATGDPNGDANGTADGDVATLPYWPKYDLADPVNIVLNANGSFLEADTWRKEGIAFINTHQVLRELLS
ncbi:Cholinesterase [Lasiodiplodia hormozganensis]|uniref:Carboxylic ester hydrolase n=1 Tax=Lasiodiplodia hormozganensis TaxID=869390 RepID=A0AA40CN14_9PEZI|nr:Cholinesterase [Lasiodiplodia hormozganensis]